MSSHTAPLQLKLCSTGKHGGLRHETFASLFLITDWEMGKKITVRFEASYCGTQALFTSWNWRFWSPELSGTYIAIHWHFAFWSKRCCLVKQSFSVAMLGLQNLFLFGLAAYSTISKGTFALRPRRSAGAQALSSASLGLNLGVASTGFLSTLSWILGWISEIVQSPPYRCCFSTQAYQKEP